MLEQVKRLIDERHFDEGLTEKEAQERVGRDATLQEVKAALNELKAHGDLLSFKKKYYRTQSRPDLLKNADAASLLWETLGELKKDSPHLYPPTLHRFYEWIAARRPITPSVIQSWIGKSHTKVAIARDPKQKEAVIFRKEDVSLLLPKDLVETLAYDLLNRLKNGAPESYPITLSQFKKQLMADVSEQMGGFKADAKMIEPYLKEGLRGTAIFLDGKSEKICLKEDKPDPERCLTQDFMQKCAQEILEKRKAEKRFKYPCTEKDFLSELAKAIQLKYPALKMKGADVKPFLPRCGDVIEWVPSGKSRKACLRGHRILIQAPKGDALKKILLEYLELKEGAPSSPEKLVMNDQELVNAFWREHRRLDEMNLQDRAVPIYKLWRALKNRTTRKAFEQLLRTLRQSGEIYLEHRASLDGLSQEEIRDCYQEEGHIFYIARRMK